MTNNNPDQAGGTVYVPPGNYNVRDGHILIHDFGNPNPLVKRLRQQARLAGGPACELYREAAATIEQKDAELKNARLALGPAADALIAAAKEGYDPTLSPTTDKFYETGRRRDH